MSIRIEGNRIYLKILSPDDVTVNYVDWLQDEEIIQYMESKWKIYTLEELREYVKATNESVHDYLFGIFLKINSEHIGNIKIGKINSIHRFGDLGVIVGNKGIWKQGIATEAIKLVTKYAFGELNLHSLTAGMYVSNLGSYKAFVKAGYNEVGRHKERVFHNGRYIDEILVEIINDNNHKL